MVAISIVVFCTLYSFFSKVRDHELPDFNWYPSEHAKFDVTRAIGVLPTVFTAFNFHYNVFPVYRSLKKANDSYYKKVILFSETWVGTFYLAVAIFGLFFFLLNFLISYMAYGENTNEDFIKSFSDLPNSLYYMVYVAYMIVVTFSIPVVFFCGRNYLMTLITRYCLKQYD